MSSNGQLYHLAEDLAEKNNHYGANPEVVSELTALMERYVAEGCSTAGPKQRNDVALDWSGEQRLRPR